MCYSQIGTAQTMWSGDTLVGQKSEKHKYIGLYTTQDKSSPYWCGTPVSYIESVPNHYHKPDWYIYDSIRVGIIELPEIKIPS